MSALAPYVRLARIDHWFKNAFMVLGVFVAFLFEPDLLSVEALPRLLLAVLATCLVASSNYVLNEILDAPTDRHHPQKGSRPIPSGEARVAIAYVEWLALAAVGFALGASINAPFLIALASLWVMALVYNVPPVRAKELPYLDVVTESINNPIRLLLGWFALIDDRLPPMSLLLAYWAFGAFFMATKRFAELRSIGDRERAALYRRSFGHYDEANLLVSILFYSAAGSLLGGVFIVRFKLELILFVPFAAGLIAYYLRLGLQPNSPVQQPERLIHARKFLAYTIICFGLFVGLFFARIPELYDIFNFPPPKAPVLWSTR